MAIRSINLKMIVPKRREESTTLRQRLWTTHQVVNQAAAEIERVLLLCRGRGYWTSETDAVSAQEVQRDALAFARAVQRANAREGTGEDQQVLTSLGQFYEALVPSVLLDDEGNPLQGNAQAAGAFAGPMMDAQSEGFQKVFEEVIDPLPSWTQSMATGDEGWQEESIAWLETEQAQRLLRAPHSPAGWVRQLRKGRPWQEAFLNDQEKKRKQIPGVPSLIRQMKRELGLLPLIRPPIAGRLCDRGEGLTPWDRLALRLAVAHLLSWESWNHRAAREHRRVQERADQQRSVVASHGHLVDELCAYQSQRHEHLMRVALADDSRPYRLGPRAVRGWERVHAAWIGPRGASRQARLASLAELQTKLAGAFGDPEFFRWLAEDGRERLWQEPDLVPDLARLNALERLLERKRDHAIWTLPHAQLHPRWTMYEAIGGSNLRNYALAIHDGRVVLRLRLLIPAQGNLSERDVEIPLAPSGQFQSPTWDESAGRVSFASSHQRFSAQLGGAEILLLRRHLENRRTEELEAGDIGPVWLKLVLDVDPQAPEGWLDDRGRLVTPPTVHHFNTGLANTSRHQELLEPGLRVLSVDLGVRMFAACSVFELVCGRPERAMAFLADEHKDLWAQHERSFVMRLPGEDPDVAALAARTAAEDEVGLLRRDLRSLRRLRGLSIEESVEQRRDILVELRSSLTEEWARGRVCALTEELLGRLELAVNSPAAPWSQCVNAAHLEAERRFGTAIGNWRRRTRPRDAGAGGGNRRPYRGGKSMWAVQYLDGVRRLLLSWSLYSALPGQIQRQDRARYGVFAVRLLDHLSAIKEDRIKAGSNLIVQAARGYMPGKRGGWLKKYGPCRLILFEDLARYRFRIDRPRRENSQLMRWSHRQILEEAQMQAQLFGILIGTTGAGYSSRFHARTASPGCRTRTLTQEDFDSPAVSAQIELLATDLGIDASRLGPGMRVPWRGGEDFVTVDDDARQVVIHADINAAQNLQRRFWTRHGDAYRIGCLGVERADGVAWYPERDGVRLRGALGRIVGGDGYSRLVETPDGDGFTLEKVTKRIWSRATGTQAQQGDEEGLDEVEAELADAVGDDPQIAQGRGRRVFLRDPSGIVLRADRWYEEKEFWGRVTRQVAMALALGNPGGSAP